MNEEEMREEYYLVQKDALWERIHELNELLKADEETGKMRLKSSSQHYVLGMLRFADYVMTNGESELDLDSLRGKK